MKYIVIALLAVLSIDISAQNDSAVTFILPALKISQNENGKNVVYKFDKPRNKIILNRDFLTGDTNLYRYKANIQDINKVLIIQNPNLVHVLIVSFIAGGLIGAAVRGYSFDGSNHATFSERLVAGLIGGGIVSFIAGGIAFLISPDKEYSLLHLSTEQKRIKLLEILRDNKTK